MRYEPNSFVYSEYPSQLVTPGYHSSIVSITMSFVHFEGLASCPPASSSRILNRQWGVAASIGALTTFWFFSMRGIWQTRGSSNQITRISAILGRSLAHCAINCVRALTLYVFGRLPRLMGLANVCDTLAGTSRIGGASPPWLR